MISINLLPKQNRNEIKSKRFNLYLTSMITIVLFLVGLAILGLFFLKIALANQTKNFEKTIEEKKQTLSQFEEQKKLIEDFNSSIALAGQLMTKEISWLAILKDLEDATPAKLRLTEFSFGTAEGGKTQTQGLTSSNQLTISGIASSLREIVKFIKKLDQSEYFNNVKLISSETTQATGEAKAPVSYNFEVSTQLNERGQ